MERFSSFVIKSKWFIILAVVVITAFLALQIPKVTINSDVISSLPADDVDAVLLKKIGNQFGGNRMGMVIIDGEDVFTSGVIQHIRQITDSLSQTEGVSSVSSLTNAMDIAETEFGMDIGPLIDEYNIPESREELAILKEKVLANEMYRGSLVSDAGTEAAIIFTLYDDADIQKVAQDVKDKTKALNLPENIYYAGSPMLITSIASLISSDLILLFPIALLVIAVVLLVSFHSWRGVILPLLVCILAIVWVIGLMGLFGYQMSMVSNNIPIVLLAVGSAYAIHVIHRIEQIKQTDRKQAIVLALSGVAIPVILTAVTTMAGFLSFIFGSYLKMIRDFGLFTALGTLFAVLLSLVFVPAVLSFFSGPKKSKNQSQQSFQKTSFLYRNFLLPLQNFLYSHPKQIVWVWLGLAAVAVIGITMIERNVDIRNYFQKDNPTRIAEDIMTEKFGGTKPIFVLFQGDVQSPELLQTMVKMEDYMKQHPGIDNTQSVAGLVSKINGAFGDGPGIPESKEMIEQLWFLLDGNDNMSKLVTNELDEALIISKFIFSENNEKKEFADYMQKFIDENTSENYKIQITGMQYIDVTMEKSLIKSKFGSMEIAVVFVIFIVGLLLRSMISGIYAAIPIVASITILFGFMGFTKIPLNIGTVLVASVAVGIGIDYSIHVISHFKDGIRKGETVREALHETISISGKAIVINLFSVSAGFLVLLFSEMVPLEYFGLLIALSMFASGLGALTLLPSILILSNKKLLYLLYF